jgi:hypothetical protein
VGPVEYYSAHKKMHVPTPGTIWMNLENATLRDNDKSVTTGHTVHEFSYMRSLESLGS